jgi:hypothetical protein
MTSIKESNEDAPVQPYLIPRHVHLCETGNQVVFLDLRRDKYLAIGRAERQALSGRVGGWPASTSNSPQAAPEVPEAGDSVIRSMLNLGLLTRDARMGKDAAHPMVEPVNEALVDDDFERRTAVRLGHLASFLFACARAKMTLRMRSLEHAVEAVRRRKARALRRGNTFDLERDRELVAIFHRLRPFVFTARDACLFDSLALVEFLAAHKSFPTWVLGVHAQPFSAHSWVQHQGFAFNGPVEYLRRFTPILAV